MKNRLFLLSFCITSFPLMAFSAEVTVCKNGEIERRVEVVSTSSEKSVPCEVKYFKEGDDSGKVLWSAQNEADYCKKKAKEFTEKLVSLGWQCSVGYESPSVPNQ